MTARGLFVAAALVVACRQDEWIPDANAEYETLVALGAYRGDLASELCPAAADGARALALRYGIARVLRRPLANEVELSIEGHPTYPGPTQATIDQGTLCAGRVRVRFSRRREQWFIEGARLLP